MLRAGLATLRMIADGVAMAANAVGTVVVLLMVLVVNYDVIARSVFSKPFLGAVEVVQFAMVLIVFLQLPDVIRVGRLTRSDGFLMMLDRRRPRAAKLQRRVIDAISMIFMALVAIAMWPEFLEMWESQDFFGVPGVFTAPWWPIKLVIFLSACLCVLLFAFKALLPNVPSGGGSGSPQGNPGNPAKPGARATADAEGRS